MYCARCRRRATLLFDLRLRGKRLRVCQPCHERDFRRRAKVIQLDLFESDPRPLQSGRSR